MKRTTDLAILIITFIIINGCNSKNPLIPNKPDSQPLIITPIPDLVRCDSLSIIGKASGYDSIFCRNNQYLIRDYISDEGLFEILVPLIRDTSNYLHFYAKDDDGQYSDTTLLILIHTSQDTIQIRKTFPRYTNDDTLSFSGIASGFNRVFCTNGETEMRSQVVNSRFYIEYPLIENARNNLMVFAIDTIDYYSDTVYISIIHDNIPPKIINSNIISDYISFDINNDIEFDFDTPLVSSSFTITAEGCAVVSLSPAISDASMHFEMNYIHLSVGRDWEFHTVVTDSANNSLDTTLYFKTYYQELSPGYNIADYFLSDDGEYLYLLTSSPNQLIVVNTGNWAIEKQMSLAFSPTDGAYNPYNGYIYITSFSNEKIIVADPEQLTEVTLLDPVIPDTTAYYPPDNPLFIAFLKNGVGFFNTKPSDVSGPYTVQMIDSRYNNLISIHPTFDSVVYEGLAPFSFHNKESLLLAGLSDSRPDYYLYNFLDNSFTKILEDLRTDFCWGIRGQQLSDIAVLNSTKGLFLLNDSGQLLGGYDSSLNLHYRGFDFTYLTGEENSVYFIDGETIGIIDIPNNTVSSSAAFSNSDGELITTYDGKYVLIIDKSAGRILVIEPKTFRI